MRILLVEELINIWDGLTYTQSLPLRFKSHLLIFYGILFSLYVTYEPPVWSRKQILYNPLQLTEHHHDTANDMISIITKAGATHNKIGA